MLHWNLFLKSARQYFWLQQKPRAEVGYCNTSCLEVRKHGGQPCSWWRPQQMEAILQCGLLFKNVVINPVHDWGRIIRRDVNRDFVCSKKVEELKIKSGFKVFFAHAWKKDLHLFITSFHLVTVLRHSTLDFLELWSRFGQINPVVYCLQKIVGAWNYT